MENDPDRVKDFMADAGECVKMITGNIKNWIVRAHTCLKKKYIYI